LGYFEIIVTNAFVKKLPKNQKEKAINYMNDYRTYALYKLTIMCMKDIWSFQAFGD